MTQILKQISLLLAFVAVAYTVNAGTIQPNAAGERGKCQARTESGICASHPELCRNCKQAAQGKGAGTGHTSNQTPVKKH